MADWQSVVVNGTTGLKGYFHANLDINQFRVGSNTHTHTMRMFVPLNGLFRRCRQPMHTMTPQGADYQTTHSLGRSGGYVHDTCKQSEKEKARKNLVLVYLIFTFQLFFGPCPAPLFRLGSSHNFFRFPPIASAFLSQFSFCKSSVPFACLL